MGWANVSTDQKQLKKMKLIKNIRHDHGEANGGTGDEKNDIKNVTTYT